MQAGPFLVAIYGSSHGVAVWGGANLVGDAAKGRPRYLLTLFGESGGLV